MKIEIKSISDIKANSYNPNVIDEKRFKALVENIKKFGFLSPILIDRDNTIIDGAHRLRAAQEAGLKEIQCVICEGAEDIKNYRKLLTLSMNNLRGENDEGKFEDVIKELGFDMDYLDIEKYTGFDVNEITDIIQNNSSVKFDENKNDAQDQPLQKCPKCGFAF